MRYVPTVVLIFLFGCATATIAPVVYEPTPEMGLVNVYSNGVPIIAFSRDSIESLFSVEHTQVAGRRYFRLWLLLDNKRSTSYLIEPLRFAKMEFVRLSGFSKGALFTMQPVPPSEVLRRIDLQEESERINRVIGGSLLAAQSSNPTPDYKSYSDVREIASWYEKYRSSINSGILRKNTIAPGKSANGYVYFEDDIRDTDTDSRKPFYSMAVAKLFAHRALFYYPSGLVSIELVPVEGE